MAGIQEQIDKALNRVMGWDKPATREQKQPTNGQNGPSEPIAKKTVEPIKSAIEERKRVLKETGR
jgi:hypothetical protein